MFLRQSGGVHSLDLWAKRFAILRNIVDFWQAVCKDVASREPVRPISTIAEVIDADETEAEEGKRRSKSSKKRSRNTRST